MASPRKSKSAAVESAAVPAEALDHAFPKLNLPIQPPYPPAEGKSVKDLPRGSGWLYEPKWDGFRCLALEKTLKSSCSQKPVSRWAVIFLRLSPLCLLCPCENLCWMVKS